ncbi:unnamed protein product, partial [Effrenium voratum]
MVQAVALVGEIKYSRVYITNHQAKLWQEEEGVVPVLAPQLAAGLKDAADMMLALDAAEECLKGTASAIAVASEDVDFAILLQKVRSWGRRALAVVPEREAKSRSRQVLESAAELVVYQQKAALTQVGLRLDTTSLDLFAEVTQDVRQVQPSPHRDRQMEHLQHLLQDLNYLPRPPDRGVLIAALAKFFHVNQLGRLTVWPLHQALNEAFAACARPGGWAKDPKHLVFMQPRGRGSGIAKLQACGGPYLTACSEDLVFRVLQRFGYLDPKAAEELSVHQPEVSEAVELFCILNQKELQKCRIQEDDTSTRLRKLHAAFSEPHRLQAWRAAYDDRWLRGALQETGDLREAMRRFLLKKGLAA